MAVHNIYEGMKAPRDITRYMLSRGVVDYSDLYQFDNYETGYSFLIVLKIPEFLSKLKDANDTYKTLINDYTHILEYDFKGLDGIDDLTIDTNSLSDGINEINIITKTNEQSAGSFTMRYYERSGSIITKVNELFIRGIKDPRTQVKRYNGLIDPINKSASVIQAGYENETFEFLYGVCDNTMSNIEKAYLLVACQPTSAEMSMYNSQKGEIQWRELNYAFNGYPITGSAVTKRAQDFLDWINSRTVFEESRFGYKSLNNIQSPSEKSTNEPTSALADGYDTFY